MQYLYTFLLLKKLFYLVLCIRFLSSYFVGIFISTKWTRAEKIRNSFALKSTFPSVLIQECGGETNYKSPYFRHCFFLPTRAFTSLKASHLVIKRTYFGIRWDSQLGSELMNTFLTLTGAQSQSLYQPLLFHALLTLSASQERCWGLQRTEACWESICQLWGRQAT